MVPGPQAPVYSALSYQEYCNCDLNQTYDQAIKNRLIYHSSI